MANRDTPRGFWPAYTLHGGPPHMTAYPKGAGNVFRGDIVHAMTSGVGGHIKALTTSGDAALTVVGVAAEYSTETGTTDARVMLNVYDDLANTIFIAQCDTTGIDDAARTLQRLTAIVTAASTCDGNEISINEIDASSTAATGGLYVLDIVDRPDNTWGAFADMYVKVVGLHGSS